MEMYFIFKVIHIFAAIISLGTGTTFSIWRKAASSPENTKFVMQIGYNLSKKYVYPGMILMLISGFGMLGKQVETMKELWIVYSAIVLIVTIILGYSIIMPSTKKMLEMFDTNRETAEYLSLAKRNKILTSALLGLAHIAVIMMVFRINF